VRYNSNVPLDISDDVLDQKEEDNGEGLWSDVDATPYLRLAEFKAIKDPTINFSVLVAEQKEKELQRPQRYYN
jgi:hypothetical protein